jgi:membrane protease YdiL (CAAX protease family)
MRIKEKSQQMPKFTVDVKPRNGHHEQASVPDCIEIKAKVDALKTSKLFKQLDSTLLESIASHAVYKSISKGAFLIRENEQASELFIIVKGNFSVFKNLDTGTGSQSVEANISILRPYDAVGEFAFIDDKPRAANVRANDNDNAVLSISYKDIQSLPTEFYRTIAIRLVHQIRNSNDLVVNKLRDELDKTSVIAKIGRFICYVLLLISFYMLALSGFVSLVSNPYTNLFASTSVISIFSAVLVVMMKHNQYSLRDCGVTLIGWRKSIAEAVGFTCIFLAFITLFKWSLIHATDRFNHFSMFDLQAIVPFEKIDSSEFAIIYTSAVIIYALCATLQEFISRGILQSSLMDFLQGKYKNSLSIVVTSGVFSAMHIHISAVLALVVFIPSVFWGWLYVRQKTLLGPIISHVMVGWWALFILGIDLMFR